MAYNKKFLKKEFHNDKITQITLSGRLACFLPGQDIAKSALLPWAKQEKWETT